MSGWERLREIDCVVIDDCPDYVSSAFGAFLVVIDLFPMWVPLVFFSVSLWQAELIFSIFGIAISADYWINFGLRQAFQQPPPTPGCGEQYEMPALATQHAIMACILLLSMIVIWNLYVSEWKLVIMFSFVSLVVFARIYIGYNTAAQLQAGTIAGLVHGLAWIAFIYYLIYPHMDDIIRWPIVRWFGFQNDICRPRSYRSYETVTAEPQPVRRRFVRL